MKWNTVTQLCVVAKSGHAACEGMGVSNLWPPLGKIALVSFTRPQFNQFRA
jgi:hypothetical protein